MPCLGFFSVQHILFYAAQCTRKKRNSQTVKGKPPRNLLYEKKSWFSLRLLGYYPYLRQIQTFSKQFLLIVLFNLLIKLPLVFPLSSKEMFSWVTGPLIPDRQEMEETNRGLKAGGKRLCFLEMWLYIIKKYKNINIGKLIVACKKLFVGLFYYIRDLWG